MVSADENLRNFALFLHFGSDLLGIQDAKLLVFTRYGTKANILGSYFLKVNSN